jgi:hypothetical protein
MGLTTILVRGLGLVVLSIWLTGCAAVAPFASLLTGSPPNGDLEVHTQTTVRLEDANFVTVRTNVVGASKGFKLLGFITLRPATMDEAMNRLYANANAEEGRPQTLAHLMVEHSAVYVILFSIPKVTTRADLIEFVAVSEEEAPSKTYGVKQVRDEPRRHRPPRSSF